MDVRQLSHFVGVANHGSFTKAAAGLNISQPALTRSVRLLEDELGVSLLLRTPQGVELTQHGDSFFRHASLILNSVKNAKAEIEFGKEGGWGEVRVGIATLFSNFLVQDAISSAARAEARFSASISVGLFEDLVDQLREGLIDVIVTLRSDDTDHGTIRFENLVEVSTVLVAGAQSELGRRKHVKVEELIKQPWVVLKHPLMDSFFGLFFGQAGLSAPASRVRTSSLDMLRSLVRTQHFVGFLPTHWVQDDLDSGTLAIIDVAGMPRRSMACVATRDLRVLNKSSELFIEELRNAANFAGQLP